MTDDRDDGCNFWTGVGVCLLFDLLAVAGIYLWWITH